MKVLLCCIGKNENQYIREYVEYYKNLGVDNICLYDNNDIDGQYFQDVIGDYIDSGFVILKDYRGRKMCQAAAYAECYRIYNESYDWIVVFDCDEFLTFTTDCSIKDYLNRIIFNKADLIHINWMNYNDGGFARNDGTGVLERFKTPCDFDFKCGYDFPEDYHVKSIVRGRRDFTWKDGANNHTPYSNDLICVDGAGIKCNANSPFTPYNFKLAYLRHYSTKTAEEYANKMKRGFPDQLLFGERIKYLVESRFFRTNEVTKEKVDVFKEKLGIDLSYLLPEKFEKDSDEENGNVKIFSLCYAKKDFKFLNDGVITPLQVGAAINNEDVCELKDNVGDNISDRNFLYIENTGTYWIWKNVHNCKYKGQMQYRRPLDGINEKFDFDKAFEKYDVITCKPFNHPTDGKPTAENNYMAIPATTVEGGYAFSNCIMDLKICESIVKKYHPDYAEDWDKYIINGENLYYSSGFILKNEDYDKYCEFLFDVLQKYQDLVGIHTKEELWLYVGRNLGAGYYKSRFGENPYAVRPEQMKWQTEIFGFLGERLWTLWLQHNFSHEKILELPYIKMEDNMYT